MIAIMLHSKLISFTVLTDALLNILLLLRQSTDPLERCKAENVFLHRCCERLAKAYVKANYANGTEVGPNADVERKLCREII